MIKKKCYSILFYFFIGVFNCFAQDGDLLIQQYNKGPGLDQKIGRAHV